MSLCIDLTLVRMNCRSIGLPPGRLNEQEKHQGLLLAVSHSVLITTDYNDKEEGEQ